MIVVIALIVIISIIRLVCIETKRCNEFQFLTFFCDIFSPYCSTFDQLHHNNIPVCLPNFSLCPLICQLRSIFHHALSLHYSKVIFRLVFLIGVFQTKAQCVFCRFISSFTLTRDVYAGGGMGQLPLLPFSKD